MRRLPRLYGIADPRFGDPVEIGRRLFAGGARLVQIRDKTSSSGMLLDEVLALLNEAPAGAVVVVNDRADVALIAKAGGVHLGQADVPARDARALLGEDRLVGISTHSVREARIAQDLPVDYLAAGPVFSTLSKDDPGPPIGLDGLEAIARLARMPVVAIGGIRLDDVGKVFDAGAASVAVISDLLGHGDIEGRTGQYVGMLESLP